MQTVMMINDGMSKTIRYIDDAATEIRQLGYILDKKPRLEREPFDTTYPYIIAAADVARDNIIVIKGSYMALMKLIELMEVE